MEPRSPTYSFQNYYDRESRGEWLWVFHPNCLALPCTTPAAWKISPLSAKGQRSDLVCCTRYLDYAQPLRGFRYGQYLPPKYSDQSWETVRISYTVYIRENPSADSRNCLRSVSEIMCHNHTTSCRSSIRLWFENPLQNSSWSSAYVLYNSLEITKVPVKLGPRCSKFRRRCRLQHV